MGRWHAKAVERARGWVSAIMDLDPKAARDLAGHFRYAESFGDLSELLDRKSLDVLHVCTPTSTHYQIAESALLAGMNLIVEKSITATAAQTRHLCDLARDRGLLICPVHQFLFQDGVLKARELLPQIGRIVHIEGTFHSAGGVGLDQELLDGIVADILPHPLSLMQFFLPAGLPNEGWTTLRPHHGEFRALGKTAGSTLSIDISMSARPTVCSFKIHGTKGTFHLDLFHGYCVIEPGKTSRTRKITHPFDSAGRRLSAAGINLGRRVLRWDPAYPGLQRLISSCYTALKNGGEPPISVEDTVAIAGLRDHFVQRAGLLKTNSKAHTK